MRRYKTDKRKWDKEPFENFKSRMTDVLVYKDCYSRSYIWLGVEMEKMEFGTGDIVTFYGLKLVKNI